MRIVFNLVPVALTVALTACGSQQPASDGHKDHTHTEGTTAAEPSKTQTYTCPMHPEVVASAPGKCPKCDMDLVLKP